MDDYKKIKTICEEKSKISEKVIDEHLFTKATSPEIQGNIDKIYVFIGLILPDINAGRKPDIQKFAAKSGIEFQTAVELVDKILNKLKK